MFSQNALVQFVFADERDNVFWNGIFRAELNKYLFCVLHEKYSFTYFIETTGGKPSVNYYGDQSAERYKPKALFGGSLENQLAKWMLNQLKNKKHPCAIIVRLETFCDLFEKEEKIMREIAEKYRNSQCGGTIVLVASHNSDKNIPYLMNSPIFDYLDEASVLMLRNTDKIDNLYSLLKTSKHSACVFLNSYTRERITELVTGVAVRSANRYPGQNTVRRMANYLTSYLNRPDMQMREQRIFDRDFPFLCPSYQEIYERLGKKHLWEVLCERSLDYARNHPDELTDHAVDHLCQLAHFIYNDNSIQMKCMKLCIPGALYDGIYDGKTIDDLNEIFSLVRSPHNRSVNPKIAAKINSFMTKLNSAQQTADKNTCSRIVAGILLCVKWLTVEDDNETVVLEKICMTENCVDASAALFNLQRQKEGFIPAEQQKKIAELQAFLQHFDDTFGYQMVAVGLSVSDVIQNVATLRGELPVITAEDISGINIYGDDDD